MTSTISYALTALAILGAFGTIFPRRILHSVLFFLLSLLSVCGLMELQSKHTIAAMTLWFLGATSLFLTLLTSLLINQQGAERSPRRLLLGKAIFVVIAISVALRFFLVTPNTASPLTETDHVPLLGLVLATVPFLLVGTFLLVRREHTE